MNTTRESVAFVGAHSSIRILLIYFLSIFWWPFSEPLLGSWMVLELIRFGSHLKESKWEFRVILMYSPYARFFLVLLSFLLGMAALGVTCEVLVEKYQPPKPGALVRKMSMTASSVNILVNRSYPYYHWNIFLVIPHAFILLELQAQILKQSEFAPENECWQIEMSSIDLV